MAFAWDAAPDLAEENEPAALQLNLARHNLAMRSSVQVG